MSSDWPNRSNFSDMMGFRLVAREDGQATVEVLVEERHANTMGIAHGGLVTSVMDTACGAAVARQPSIQGRAVSTVSIQVTYLGPSFVGETLTVTARRRGLGRKLLTCDVEARNARGECVAIGMCTLRVRSSDGPVQRRPES
jgi:acyl-CoA thioesterase